MKEALVADFPSDTYNVTKEADAETRYAQAGLRNQLTQVIARGLVATRGDAAGQYNATAMEAFDTKEAAFAAGRAYRQKFSPNQGLIGCICAELDENNQADFNYFRICQTWY